MREWQDGGYLRELYHGKGLSQRQIADKLGCSVGTIHNWMDRHDIQTRDASHERPPSHFFDENGRERICTTVNGESKWVYVHRLIAVAEHGYDAVVGNEVHHRNGVPWDNRPSNLEVLTPGEHRIHHNNLGTLR